MVTICTGIYIPDNVLTMSAQNILEKRQKARAAKRLVDADLINLHRRAVDALLDAACGEEIRQKALAQIEKWECESLCSPRYIRAWRHILSLPVHAISQAILRGDDEGISLRQNTPFGFLI